jgi:hypothetical protein
MDDPVCFTCAARHTLIGALAAEMLDVLAALAGDGHADLDAVAWARLHNLVERRLGELRQETP